MIDFLGYAKTGYTWVVNALAIYGGYSLYNLFQ